MTGQVILPNGGSYTNSGDIVFTDNSLESTSPTNPADVTNSGSIVATAQDGTAVFLEDGGEVTNNAGATIGSSTTGGDGILTGPGTGATTVTNKSEIYGVNGWAVSLAGDGTVANDDVIEGAGGVSIGGVGQMVTNNKTITATATMGVSIGDGGTVVNAAGATITGASDGISIASGSGAAQGTVTNSGSIVATAQDGTAVFLEDGGEVTNNAGATIGSSTTGGDGILTGPGTGATTVTNKSEIYGVNGWAVSLAGDGTVANDDVIEGAGGVSIGGVGQMVTNNKTITATATMGVSIGDGGTVVNAAGATITGASDGISIASGSGAAQGTVTNSGSIVATAQDGTAVFLEDGGEVTNNAGATIGSSTTGGDGILTGPGTGATTVTNTGEIYGLNGWAVSLAGDGTVANDDVIEGAGGVSIGGVGQMVTNNKTITATATMGVSIGDGGTVVNAAGATITGASDGISIASGSGAAQGTVTNSGSIVATAQDGTAVFLEDGGEVTNNAGATIGSSTTGGDGILTGPGTGATTVTNDGEIYGLNGWAVSLAGDGTVANDDVIEGAGGVSIGGVGQMVTNNKTIAATATMGVSIGDGGTVVNAAGATITGASDGISIASGSGAAQGTVTNSGSIVATAQDGTAVFLEDGGEVTNNAGATIGSSTTGGDGILTGPGTGATTVTNDGEIYGVNGWAVSLAGDGTVANDDVIEGAGGVSIGGVGQMVTNNKTITATATMGVSIGDGGTVVNAAGATITGASDGISIAGGSGAAQGTVTNSGSIVATAQDGTAVFLEDGGEVTNNAGATIGSSTTGGDGILTGPGTGATTLVNNGSIHGDNGWAVSFAGDGSIINNGTIEGASGVSAGDPILNNFGALVGAIGAAVQFNGNSIIFNFATITGAPVGISVEDGLGNIFNVGAITATDQDGSGIELALGGAVENALPTSTITGMDNGVDIEAVGGAVENAGQITGANGAGVDIDGAGQVTNADLISGHQGVDIALIGQVTNTAVIRGTGEAGVSMGLGGNLVNSSIGAISGVTNGVEIEGASGSVDNNGGISATGENSDGVSLADGGSVSNDAGGASISGADNGVSADDGNLTVNNHGAITGGAGDGVDASEGGSVTNSKLIKGPAGVDIGQKGSVANTGQIQATSGIAVSIGDGGSVANGVGASLAGVDDGVEINGAVGALINQGAITASSTSSAGVLLELGGVVINLAGATIEGGAYGVLAQSGETTIDNFGAISGNVAVSVDDKDTVVDAGEISSTAGDNGVAVDFNSTGSTFVLDQGATLTGGVAGFAAGDTLEFGVSGSTVNGYETSAGPSGMTTLTLTDNDSAVVSIDLVGDFLGDGFTLTDVPGGQFVTATLGADKTTVNVASFESEESSLNAISGGFDIADDAAKIESGLSKLDADASHIDSISAANAPVVESVTPLLDDAAALNEILGGFDISDQAATIASNLGAIENEVGHIDAITALAGPVIASVATFEADEPALNEIAGGFDVSDSAANIATGLAFLEADTNRIGSIASGDGLVAVAPADVGPNETVLDKITGGFEISGFNTDNPIDLTSLTFKSSYEAIFRASAVGGVLEIVDAAENDEQVASFTLDDSLAGELTSLSQDASGGTEISAASVPFVMAAPGDVVVSNISGQPYSAYEQVFDDGVFQGVDYDFTQVPGGAAYSGYAYDYSAGNEFIGSKFFYNPTQTGATYAGEEYDYDGDGRLTRFAVSGVTNQDYSAYEYDYVGGVFSGSEFTYTEVPGGAAYSSYEVDYNHANAFAGEQYFYTEVTGQPYTGEEEDFGANGELSRILLTGVTGQPYYQLEEDFSAGAYEGYKAHYLVTGQAYTNEEVDVSASGALQRVVYSGLTSTPYSSVEQDYADGVVADVTYSYTDVTGQTYYAYQVEENGAGAAEQETFDLSSGDHTLIALTAGQTLSSLGNDEMTGDGATTFVLNAIYGADTITNFNSDDTISLPAGEFANFAAVTAAAAPSGANVVITASDGDTLTLKNLTTATLAGMSSNFKFTA